MGVPDAVSADEKLVHVREMRADVAVRVGADRIELFTGGVGIHREYHVSLETMPVPAQPDPVYPVDAIDVVKRVRDPIDQLGLQSRADGGRHCEWCRWGGRRSRRR